jgi:hypothetical protein
MFPGCFLKIISSGYPVDLLQDYLIQGNHKSRKSCFEVKPWNKPIVAYFYLIIGSIKPYHCPMTPF